MWARLCAQPSGTLSDSYRAAVPYTLCCMMDESNGLVRALQSLSEAFSGRGRVPPPPPWGIVYRADPRLVVRNCKLG